MKMMKSLNINVTSRSLLLSAYSDPLSSSHHVKKPLMSMKIAIKVNSILPAILVCELWQLFNIPDVLPFPIFTWQFKGIFG